VLVGRPPATMMLSVRSRPASNLPATKHHNATRCTVSLRCHQPADQC
jgi:hypothetical protein